MPLFRNDLYVKVFENRIQVRNVGNRESVEILATKPFSHSRALVGDFDAAYACLKTAISAAKGSGLVFRMRILIQPMEKIEGGLTQVEDRLFTELALRCGASKVLPWAGESLSDEAVIEKLRTGLH
jgi:rod shape-determining protein MreB and related proteins